MWHDNKESNSCWKNTLHFLKTIWTFCQLSTLYQCIAMYFCAAWWWKFVAQSQPLSHRLGSCQWPLNHHLIKRHWWPQIWHRMDWPVAILPFLGDELKLKEVAATFWFCFRGGFLKKWRLNPHCPPKPLASDIYSTNIFRGMGVNFNFQTCSYRFINGRNP